LVWCERLRELLAAHLGAPRPTREANGAQRGDTMPLAYLPGAAPSW
jgi:hypothetical protein